MLRDETLKSGSGCPDPQRPPSDERGVMRDSEQAEIQARGSKTSGS
jgi:hypothetical protein